MERLQAEHRALRAVEHFAALLPIPRLWPSETGGNQISDSVLGRPLELGRNTGESGLAEGAITHSDVF